MIESHTAPITGIAINPSNSFQLLTSSLDGTIKVWDYLDAILLRTIDVGFPISHMIAHSSLKGSVYVALKKPKSSGSTEGGPVDPFFFSGRCNSIIQLVSLSTVSTKGAGATRSQSVTRVGKARHTTSMALSFDAKFLVLIGKRKVHVARTDALKEGFTKIITDQELTCLAFHPESNAFATGDSIGQIRLWYFLDQEKQLPKPGKGLQVAPSVVFHWHSHAVSSLIFTPNGANLLSGGEESVMVLWQISSQNREFVPRLGGAKIESLSILESRQGHEEEYVACLGDGSIAFISAINLKPNRTITQVLVDSSRHILGKEYLANLSFPLAIHPNTNQLVMNAGHASSLQFFDVEADRLVSQMEVLPSNRVSRPDDIPLEPSRVDKVCFSSDGEWMATIESRGTREVTMKVWKWEIGQKRYNLNSRIEGPHKEAIILTISFSPRDLDGSPLLLTSGNDNQVRTWRMMTQDMKGGKKEDLWIARSAFHYRQLPLAEACWSLDGSLVALAHETCVTLWEPVSNSLQQVIQITGKAKSLTFAGKAGRYLVILSSQGVIVWDNIFGQVTWEKEVNANHLLSNGHDQFLLLSNERNSTTITSYSPLSNEKVGQYRISLLTRQVCKVVQSTSKVLPCFFALTEAFDVIRVGVASSQETNLPGHTAESLRGQGVKRRTLYDELIGPRQGQAEQIEESAAAAATLKSISTLVNSRSTQVAGGLFDVASHLLPPMSALYPSMISQLLPKRMERGDSQDGNKFEEKKNDDEEEDQAIEDEPELVVSSSRIRQVSQMEWSGLSLLFEKQARLAMEPADQSLAPKDTSNGQLIHGSKNGKVITVSPQKKSSPNKSTNLSNGQATPSSPPFLADASLPNQSPMRSIGRKRKQQPVE